MSEWIKCGDRQPGFPKTVLVAYHSDSDGEPCLDTGVAMLHPDGVWRGAGVFYRLGQDQRIGFSECVQKVTHWMPLPEPPAVQPNLGELLTIPGALEWDGDNGTHGADGESRADGESAAAPSAYTAVDMTTAAADGFRDGQTAATDALKAFAAELIGASFEGGSFDGGDIQDIGVKHGLLRIEQRTEECGEVCACREYGFPAECYRKTDLLKSADPAKCESCGDWGHIETEDSAHDCPECGPSVIERAVEAGVMNAPKPYATDDIPDFTPGSGNKAKRRIEAIEKAKQKTCIECDQPYCHGVCVERGDQDYGRDQAAKGGCDE